MKPRTAFIAGEIVHTSTGQYRIVRMRGEFDVEIERIETGERRTVSAMSVGVGIQEQAREMRELMGEEE